MTAKKPASKPASQHPKRSARRASIKPLLKDRRAKPAWVDPDDAPEWIDADVVEHFRATGPGWQTRINDTLRRAAKRAGR